MPRPNVFAYLTPPVKPQGEGLRPPADLGPAERGAWLKVVASVPPGHFQAADEPLLRRLVNAIVSAERCEAAMEAEPDATKLRPLVETHAAASRTMISAGAKLRLWGHRRKPLPPLSPLERMKLEGLI